MYKVVKNSDSYRTNKRDITLKKSMSNKISIADTSEGGQFIVAHIPDYVPDNQAFASIICKCLNENNKYFTLSQIKKMRVKVTYGAKSGSKSASKK